MSELVAAAAILAAAAVEPLPELTGKGDDKKKEKPSWLEKLGPTADAEARLRGVIDSLPEKERAGFADVMHSAFHEKRDKAFDGVAAGINDGASDIAARVGLVQRYETLRRAAGKIAIDETKKMVSGAAKAIVEEAIKKAAEPEQPPAETAAA